MKTKDAVFAAAQENFEQKKTVYEKELAELRQKVNDQFADLSKIEKPTFTVLDLECKLTSSPSKAQDLNRQVVSESEQLDKCASVAVSAEQAAFDM